MASLISPVFLSAAEELLQRLDRAASAGARPLASEAGEFVRTFQSWLAHSPDDTARVTTISRFLDLNRRASDFLACGPPSSKGTPRSGDR